jgi:hypothetical protein
MGAVAQLSESAVDVEPGRTATLSITVRNNGTVVDRFTFEALGAGASWVTFSPPSLSLFPEASGTASIVLAPPRLPTVHAGPTPLGIRVSSAEDPSGSVVEEATVNVAAFSDVTLELIPRVARGRVLGRAQLAVDNRSNCSYRAAVSGSDPQSALQFRFRPPVVDVGSGNAQFVKVAIRPTHRFWRGPQRTRAFRLALQDETDRPDDGEGVGGGPAQAFWDESPESSPSGGTGSEVGAAGSGGTAGSAVPSGPAGPGGTAGSGAPGGSDAPGGTALPGAAGGSSGASRPGGGVQPGPPGPRGSLAGGIAPPPGPGPTPGSPQSADTPPGGVRAVGPTARTGVLTKPARTSSPHKAEMFAEGSMLQEPILPRWLVSALAALIALIALFALLWFTLFKPQIRSTAQDEVNKQLTANGITPVASTGSSKSGTGSGAGSSGSAGGGSGAGAGGGSGNTVTSGAGGSGGSSAAGLTVNGGAQAAGNGTRLVFTVPNGRSLQVTDLLVENSAGDTGNLALARNGQSVMEWSMANFRDLDYHWITPTVFGPGSQMQLVVSGCSGACTPGIYYAGRLVAG